MKNAPCNNLHLKDKQPKTPERLGKLADQYTERMRGQRWFNQIQKRNKPSFNGNSKPKKPDDKTKTSNDSKSEIKCHACQEIGHIAPKCPNKTKEFIKPGKKTGASQQKHFVADLPDKYKLPGKINDRDVTILCDSACDQSIVAE